MTPDPTPPTPLPTPPTPPPTPFAAPPPTPRWRTGRPRALALLAGAVACEAGGTAALQASEGFSRPEPALAALLGYLLTIVLFSRALTHGVALGIAYGTVTGGGLLAAAVVATVLAGAPPTASQTAGLLAILAGTLVLQVRPRPVPHGPVAP